MAAKVKEKCVCGLPINDDGACSGCFYPPMFCNDKITKKRGHYCGNGKSAEMKEGIFKPGERNATKKCPKCKGTRSASKTDSSVPCPKCHGSGKVMTGEPSNPTQYFSQGHELSDNEKKTYLQHLTNMPPKKLADVINEIEHFLCPSCGGKLRVQNNQSTCTKCGKVIKEPEWEAIGSDTGFEPKEIIKIREAEEKWCPTCKINVEPEGNACPQCGSMKLEPYLQEQNPLKIGQKLPQNAQKIIQQYQNNEISFEQAKQDLMKSLGCKEGSASVILKTSLSNEMSTVGSVGGFNAPMGKTDNGIKHNFRVREMKTFKKLIREIRSRPDLDLSKFASSFTSFIDKKSKNGELQKQFPKAGYSPAKLMTWIRTETDKEGTHVSDDYLSKLEARLTGNPIKDMKTLYFADLKGAGLGVGQLNKKSKGDDDVIDEEEWQ
jgi:Zn finger protein HypA/HybF involved in hydrogenase expression